MSLWFESVRSDPRQALHVAAAVVLLQGVALCDQLPYTVNASLSCGQVQELPGISFRLGGRNFSIQPAAYAYQVSCWKCVATAGRGVFCMLRMLRHSTAAGWLQKEA